MEPDSIDDAVMLISAERLGSRPRDALAVVESLRKLVSPLRDDPRIDFAEARVLGDLADFRRAQQSATVVERKALALGMRLLYAKARLFESGTMQNLGMPQATTVRRKARQLCADLGDKACVVSALRTEANQTLMSSSPALAKKLYQQGLEISREMGSGRETTNLLAGLGAAFAELDDFPSAESSYAEGLATAREMGSLNGVNIFQVDLADVYTSEGRLQEADTIYRRAISLDRGTGRRENLGNELTGFANVLRLEGKPDEASRAVDEALRVLRPTGEVDEIATALTVRGDSLLDMGEVENARKDYEQAGALRPGARADLALANALFKAHEPATALSKASEAMRIFQAEKNARGEALSQAVLIQAMLAQGKVPEALETAKGTKEGNLRNPYGRMTLGIAVARAQAAVGNQTDALKQLSILQDEASRLGFVSVLSEARLVYSEVLARSGR